MIVSIPLLARCKCLWAYDAPKYSMLNLNYPCRSYSSLFIFRLKPCRHSQPKVLKWLRIRSPLTRPRIFRLLGSLLH